MKDDLKKIFYENLSKVDYTVSSKYDIIDAVEATFGPVQVKDEQKSQWREFKAGIVTEDICPGSEPVKDVCPECGSEEKGHHNYINKYPGVCLNKWHGPIATANIKGTAKPPIDDVREALSAATRQYRHNNSDGFVFGYDIDETTKIVTSQQAEIDQIKISARDHANTYMSEIEELSTELDEYKLLLKEERMIHSDDKAEIDRLKAENEARRCCGNCAHFNNGSFGERLNYCRGCKYQEDGEDNNWQPKENN